MQIWMTGFRPMRSDSPPKICPAKACPRTCEAISTFCAKEMRMPLGISSNANGDLGPNQTEPSARDSSSGTFR